MEEKFALVKALRASDAAKGKKAKHFFDNNASVISYPTGYPTLDYALGYKVNVYDDDGKPVDTYPSLGITAGSFCEIIGPSGCGKTSAVISIAANIVRPFDNGMVIHYDFEQASNYTRIQALTKFKMRDMYQGQYILKQERMTLSEIKQAIIEIYKEKVGAGDKYKYNTGKKNEFNEDIIIYQPTVIIIDSIATISVGIEETSESKTLEKAEDITSQTERMRLTAEIGRFMTDIFGYIREANIIILAINHINAKPQLGIVHQPPDISGLKQDETCPGGKKPLYLAHILLRLDPIGSEKYSLEEDGFDGFGVKCRIVKSRVSSTGTNIHLVFDTATGVNMVRSSVEFCKDIGLIGGNRNGYYFDGNKDDKFTLANMDKDFVNNPNLYKIMKNTIIPILEPSLSGIRPDEVEMPSEEFNFYNI